LEAYLRRFSRREKKLRLTPWTPLNFSVVLQLWKTYQILILQMLILIF
jgi:hypothetical protein